MIFFTAILPLLLLAAASLSLLWTNKWRYNIASIAVQYLVVFWFVVQVWPIELAVIKLIVGWMAGAVLGASVTANARPESEPPVISVRIFRVIAGVFIIILSISAAARASVWIPTSTPALIASFFLIGMGLLNLSFTKDPLRVIIGLLTTMSGFEIAYAAVVNSVLVIGLLALVTLGIALSGAYFLNINQPEGAI